MHAYQDNRYSGWKVVNPAPDWAFILHSSGEKNLWGFYTANDDENKSYEKQYVNDVTDSNARRQTFFEKFCGNWSDPFLVEQAVDNEQSW